MRMSWLGINHLTTMRQRSQADHSLQGKQRHKISQKKKIKLIIGRLETGWHFNKQDTAWFFDGTNKQSEQHHFAILERVFHFSAEIRLLGQDDNAFIVAVQDRHFVSGVIHDFVFSLLHDRLQKMIAAGVHEGRYFATEWHVAFVGKLGMSVLPSFGHFHVGNSSRQTYNKAVK